jgi:hypothetical protein
MCVHLSVVRPLRRITCGNGAYCLVNMMCAAPAPHWSSARHAARTRAATPQLLGALCPRREAAAHCACRSRLRSALSILSARCVRFPQDPVASPFLPYEGPRAALPSCRGARPYPTEWCDLPPDIGNMSSTRKSRHSPEGVDSRRCLPRIHAPSRRTYPRLGAQSASPSGAARRPGRSGRNEGRR